ncbi:MAG TPA: cytochrome c1 [Alphaproteobacteria bacterium]|nr:cytochrome c1 [Alphaproteobacteria bacterium]
MSINLRRALLPALGLLAVFAVSSANAAEGEVKLQRQSWAFDGPFGTYDRAALQRGFQIYKEVCSACHAVSLVAYRNLSALGFSEAEVKAIAAAYEVQDKEPNDQGEYFTRPARPADHFKSPFANEQAARAANNGAYPPDLSLITKARLGGGGAVFRFGPSGSDYVYALLTGYKPAPAGVTVPEGMNYNEAFHGHMIAMAQPLNDGAVTFADNTQATVPQMAKDVTTFLTWAAEPEMEARKRLGLKVMLFLLLMTGVFYAWKRKVWKDLH